MTAAVLHGPRKLHLQQVDKPTIAEDEVLVRISQVGICGSDVHLYQGHRDIPYPMIIGHEAIGVIEAVGAAVDRSRISERVVIEPNYACLTCRFCREGRTHICANKKVLGINQQGCFAQYISVPATYAWRLPTAISDDDAVVIEPTAVAYHALAKCSAERGDTLAIIGLGAIGLLLCHIALQMGYKVVVSEINQQKLSIATDMGAIAIPIPKEYSAQIKVMTDSFQAHDVRTVYECAGSEHTASLAMATAPRGSEIVLLGLSDKVASFQPLRIVREGIRIIPSIIYDHPTDFAQVINLIESQSISPGFVISRYLSFRDIDEALILASSGIESKIIVNINVTES